MFERSQQAEKSSAGSPVCVAFDGRSSAADLLEHMANGREIVGAGDLDRGIRENLAQAAPYGRHCSRRVLEPFAVMRAASLHCYPQLRIPRLGADDRFADNLELISDAYQLPDADGLRRPHAVLRLMQTACKPGGGLTDQLAEFLMRTHTEYLKILTFYLELKSLPELGGFVERFPGRAGLHQAATEALIELPTPFLELVLATGTIKSPAELARFVEAGEHRELCDFCRRAGFSNISVISDHLVFNAVEEAEAYFDNQRLRQNLLAVNCQRLMRFVQKLQLDERDSVSFFLDLITGSYSPDAERALEKVDNSGMLETGSPRLRKFLGESLLYQNWVRQSLQTAAAPHAEGLLSRDSQIADLETLRLTLQELLAPELAVPYVALSAKRAKDELLREYAGLRADMLRSAARSIDRRIYEELHCTLAGRENAVMAAAVGEPLADLAQSAFRARRR